MATQKTTFMETGQPFVRRIWKALDEGIPSQYTVDATRLLPPGMSQKSITESAELRRLGDKSYTSGKFNEAFIFYSKSVAFAPADTRELALAYGKRSAVFQGRMQYEPCLLDVNRALAGSLPLRTRRKLVRRKKLVWDKLQVQNEVQKQMREFISITKHIRREEDTLTACERRLHYISKVGVDDVDLVIDHSELDDPIWNTKFDGTSLENVSPKIELKYDAEMGPYLVAKDDIKPGEPLCTEDLYSLSLLESMKLKYCDYCHFRCEALIPCTNCTVDMYCSTGCREKAYDSYHRIECQILPLWVDIDESAREIRGLHLRTFLRSTKQGSELANLMKSSVVCEALDGKLNCANLPFSPENYPILANMVSRLRCSNVEKEICYQSITGETMVIFAGLRSLQFFGSEDGRTQIRSDRRSKYTVYSREERRKLHEYLGCPSDCTCKACVEDWPKVIDFVSKTDAYLTLDEKTRLRIQTMREWLEEDSTGPFSKVDLVRVIEFSRSIREDVKEPSPIIILREYYIQRVMVYKGNLFVEYK